MAHAGDGICGGAAYHLGWLAALEWIFARRQKIWSSFPHYINLGPGGRAIWRAALHLRNPGFFSDCPSHCGAVGNRDGSISHRARSFMDTAAVCVIDRNVGCHPERNSRIVGNFRNDSVATGLSLSMA